MLMAKNDKINAETKKVFEAIRYSYPISNDDFASSENQIKKEFRAFADEEKMV